MDIKFVCSDGPTLKHFPVKPAKDCLPDWYKNLPADRSRQIEKGDMTFPPFLGDVIPTVAKCMPVRDVITAGYIIPNAFEQKFQAGEDNFGYEDWIREVNTTANFDPQNGHHHEQCPVKIDGKKKNYFKILVPWKIITPPGYSVLIVPPMFRENNKFEALPAIIDSDMYDAPYQNFPFYLKQSHVTIMPGEPLVQVIPFKRDEWKSTIEYEPSNNNSALKFYLHNMYKRIFHSKKRFN